MMTFTAGSDVSTSDLITAATWNSYMGVSGSIDYLKVEADKLDDLTVDASPSRVKDTTYSNSSGKTRFVAIEMSMTSGTEASARTDGNTPPTTEVTAIDNNSAATDKFQLFFVVLNGNNYILVETSGTITINTWIEWEDH